MKTLASKSVVYLYLSIWWPLWHRDAPEISNILFLRKDALVHSALPKEVALNCTSCRGHLLIGPEAATWPTGNQFIGWQVAWRVVWQGKLWPVGIRWLRWWNRHSGIWAEKYGEDQPARLGIRGWWEWRGACVGREGRSHMYCHV